jgi:hypothetical protein
MMYGDRFKKKRPLLFSLCVCVCVCVCVSVREREHNMAAVLSFQFNSGS